MNQYFRSDEIRSCCFRDIKGFEHGLDFANRERVGRSVQMKGEGGGGGGCHGEN